MREKLKAELLVIVGVFVIAAAPQFILNVTNVFDTPLATWEVIVNAGVIAVVAYAAAYFTKIVPAFGRGSGG